MTLRTRRVLRRLSPAVLALAAVVAAGSAAAAVVVLHGRAELVSEPLTGGLEVVGARLEPLLVPGQSSDLVVDLRNRSAVTVVTDQVRLLVPLRDARPAGCTARVSGPLLAPAGLTLPADQRVVLGPGRAAQLVVPSALALSASATSGCGFRVQVDVRATQAVPPTRPTAVPPISPPSTTGPTPPAPSGSTGPVVTPPPLPTFDCDPADPSCEPPTTGNSTTPPPLPTLDCDDADPDCPPN